MHHPTARLLATLVVATWLIGGLVLTLQPAHPLPGQTVDDNLIPFRTLAIYWRNLGSEFWLRNLFGNLLLLLPLGLLGPVALPVLDRWRRVALVALLVSVTIELTQLAVPDRSADIDDVIVNAAGALLGYAALRLTRGLGRKDAATPCSTEGSPALARHVIVSQHVPTCGRRIDCTMTRGPSFWR